MIKAAIAYECDVIGFDYRGVGSSEGKLQSKNDLVKDGIAPVAYLLANGANPENIFLNKHSLGGAMATLVAAHFHEQGQKVYLFNDRSFSTITNIIVGWIRTFGQNNGHIEKNIYKVLGWLSKLFISIGLRIVDWEIDADSAYAQIPNNYKLCAVVRSSKLKRNPNSYESNFELFEDDSIITHYASLYKTLPKGENVNSFKVTTSPYVNGHGVCHDRLMLRSNENMSLENILCKFYKKPSENCNDTKTESDQDNQDTMRFT